MSIFHEIPPTASFPLHLRDFIALPEKGDFEQDFRGLLGVPYARLACSGTASLYLILEAMKELSPKRTVIIPSFICPAVAYALERAGLKIEICDVMAERFDYDEAQLELLCAGNDILAVIAMHLAGIPAEMGALQRITRARGIFLVEDAAQALGAEYDGKKIGTFGDFAFFSLGRGKGLTIYEGGMIIAAKPEHGAIIDKKINELVRPDPWRELQNIIGLLGYGLFYRPLFFWFIYKLPRHFWHKFGNKFKAMAESARLDFPVHAVSDLRKSLGHRFFHNLSPQIAAQRWKADYYFRYLQSDDFTIIKELPGSTATYPYVALLFKSAEKRQQVMEKIDGLGLGPGIIYLHAIADYEYLAPYIPAREYPNGRNFAAHTLTLSTNAYLTTGDLLKIVSIANN